MKRTVRKGPSLMNILFLLTPKSDCAYVREEDTIRQALERMSAAGFAAVPILAKDGTYRGTLTEGDLLWAIKNQGIRIENAEEIPIKAIPRKRDYLPVTVNTQMDELVAAAMNQNFVPVLDDKRSFIGIVKRGAIIQYCYDRYRGGGKGRPAPRKFQTESRV